MARVAVPATIRTAMDATWLKEELSKPGRSQSALARFMGLDSSAVNRITTGQRQIKVAEAEKINAYLAATGRGSGSGPVMGVGEMFTDFVHLERPLIQVEGIVEAGAWRDGDSWKPPGPRTIPVVAIGPLSGDTFALRVAGSSMNEFYPDGSYVIVRRWGGGALPFGKHVVVQRTRPDGLYEYTVKELREAGDLPELWPRSTDPAFQDPVRYGHEGELNVEMIGVVIATWRVVD